MRELRTMRGAGRAWVVSVGAAASLGLCAMAQAQDAAVSGDGGGSSGSGSDLAERVILRAEGRYDLTLFDRTEEKGPQLEEYADDAIRTGANLVLGDLRLGTRGLGLSGLNTYASVSAGYNVDGQPNLEISPIEQTQDATQHPYIQDGYGDATLFVQSAYAELEGFTESGPLSHLSLRAGRQYHWGASSISFDGATLGWDDGALSASVRFGQRSAIYNRTQDDPGLVGGAQVAYDFKPTVGVPLYLKGEYLLVSRELSLEPGLTDCDGDFISEVTETLESRQAHFCGNKESLTTGVADLNAYFDVNDDVLLQGRARVTGSALSRVNLGLRWNFGDSGVLADFTQKIGEEPTFDLASGVGRTVVNPESDNLVQDFERTSTHEALRLNIPNLQPFSELYVRVPLALTDAVVVQPSGGARLSLGEAEALSPYDASFFHWGLLVELIPKISEKAGLEVQGEYRGRIYDRDNVLTLEEGGQVQTRGLFSDVQSGPEQDSHELSGSVTYTRGGRFVGNRMLGNRTLSVGAGGFYKLYTLQTRRFVIEEASQTTELGEALVGANLFARWWVAENVAVKGRYEYAKDSNILYPHLSAFQLVQGSVEVQY